jgi:hypothetical protein
MRWEDKIEPGASVEETDQLVYQLKERLLFSYNPFPIRSPTSDDHEVCFLYTGYSCTSIQVYEYRINEGSMTLFLKFMLASVRRTKLNLCLCHKSQTTYSIGQESSWLHFFVWPVVLA